MLTTTYTKNLTHPMDGTWKHGSTNVTNKQRKWLEKNGWIVP